MFSKASFFAVVKSWDCVVKDLKQGRIHYPKWQFLGSSKLKEFADNNFLFDENGGEFSNRFDNTVGKGEIAHYEQFLLFPQCFQKTCKALICGLAN